MSQPTQLRVDAREAYMEDQAVRALATKAFYQANTDPTLRQAMLAKTRTDDGPLKVGGYAYYWRIMMEASRWRGSALVCAVESRPDGRPDVYWMAHGSSLVRFDHVMTRREVPSERVARLEQLPDAAAREPAKQRVLRALRPVRGPPIRFFDLVPDGPSVDTEAMDAKDTKMQVLDTNKMGIKEEIDTKSVAKEKDTNRRNASKAEIEEEKAMELDVKVEPVEKRMEVDAVDKTSEAASQPASKQASKGASERASRQARQQARQQASKQASQPASKPASQPASKGASERASRQARQQGSKAARQQGSKQANKQASKQASQRASEPASKRASKQASQPASKQASQPGSQPGNQQASQQASKGASQRASRQASKQASQGASKGASEQTIFLQGISVRT